jgi:hypothetical protein
MDELEAAATSTTTILEVRKAIIKKIIDNPITFKLIFFLMNRIPLMR